MLEWQERVVEEKDRINDNLIKLKTFLLTEEAKNLSHFQNNLLKVQRIAMQQYLDILKRRIECFDK